MATTVLTFDQATEAPSRTYAARSGPAYWMLIFALIFFALHGVFSFEPQAVGSGAYLHGKVLEPREHGLMGGIILPGLAYLVVLLHLKSRYQDVLTLVRRFKLFTILALLTLVSVLWSQDPFRTLTFSTLYIVEVLFAYYLVIEFTPEEIMKMMTDTGLTLAIICLAMVVLFPTIGIETHSEEARAGAWRGLFLDRVSAAKTFTFLLSPALFQLSRKVTVRKVLYAAFIAFMILRARAMTAVVCLLMYVVCLVALRLLRKAGTRASMAFLIIGALMGIVVVIVGIQVIPVLLQSLNRDVTLSGRTQVWAAVIVSILKRPFLGYGYMAFWEGLKGESGVVIHTTNWSFGYAHDQLLEIFLQLGLLGVGLIFFTLVQAVKNAWYCFRYDQSGRYDWYISLLPLTILYNFDEETMFFPIELLSILYIVICCGLAVASLQVEKNKYTRLHAPIVDDLSLAG